MSEPVEDEKRDEEAFNALLGKLVNTPHKPHKPHKAEPKKSAAPSAKAGQTPRP